MRGMSFLLSLKPFLTALVLPMASGLLIIWVGVLSGRRLGLRLAALACVVLGLLACQGTALVLSKHLLPHFEAVIPQMLKDRDIQAIVVLGGGAQRDVPEYQGHVLSPESMARLMYGVHLQRATGLPIAFTGGVGWSDERGRTSEAEVAAQTLARLGLPAPKWLEDQSKDTHQNAVFTRALLKAQGIDRVAIVTHAWHMPRSQREFEAAGFAEVLPAPMGFIRSDASPLLQWIPSADGIRNTTWVLREWLGLQVQKLYTP
jgi:uncharacterized SAM-binding protein YcdF (DUF218 family)